MEKPNFIAILTDDQGYGDLSCMGAADFKTPNFDRLARSGARFTSWYANSAVCSPSRASLLTGRYPGNAGVRSILPGGRRTVGLLPEIPTLASALKPLGYRTAMFGKWHLGVTPECRPENHGFDEWMGFLAGCIDYYSHIFYWGMAGGVNPVHDLWENGEEIHRDGRYFTEMVTDGSVDFIRRAAKEKKPFFLFTSYNAPHYPMHAPQKYLDRFSELPPDRRIMAAMLSAVDDGVGDMLDELERQGILRNTCIFFQSDNGPSREARNWLDGTEDLYYGGKTGKLKGHKFSLYEGGIRVPAIMSWPGGIPAGRVITEPGIGMDIFPTFLKMAGGDPSQFELDGKDIWPMITSGASTPHDQIFWELEQQTAVRCGKWKLVLHGRLDERTLGEDEVHLSDLGEDVGEKINLKDQFPDITKKLTQAAETWRKGIEDESADEPMKITNP